LDTAALIFALSALFASPGIAKTDVKVIIKIETKLKPERFINVILKVGRIPSRHHTDSEIRNKYLSPKLQFKRKEYFHFKFPEK